MLDAEAFRTQLDEGRRALSRGEPETAAETLREALALWRGPALAEFRYQDFAQPEIARLEELRLAAQEERIEADLELGDTTRSSRSWRRSSGSSHSASGRVGSSCSRSTAPAVRPRR